MPFLKKNALFIFIEFENLEEKPKIRDHSFSSASITGNF